MRTPFDILSDYERRSLAHAVQLPARDLGAETWRGVGYRIGRQRLVSQFGEVVEIMPMPPVTPVPGAQPWLLGIGNLLSPFKEGTVEKSTAHVIEEIRNRYR